MNDYDKNEEPSYLKFWDVNNLYGWAILQKLPENNSEWIKDTFQFNEDFIKNYNKENDEFRYFPLGKAFEKQISRQKAYKINS